MASLTMDQFAVLASPLRHRLECQARRTVKDDAEDVVSDTFLDAIERIDAFSSDPTEHALYSWLVYLMRQRITRWRRAHRVIVGPLTESTLAEAMRRLDEQDEETLIRAERLGEAKRRLALAPLTPVQRVCIVAHIDGERQVVTAARLRTSVDCVGYHLRIAKMKMRAVPANLVASADLDGFEWRIGTRVTIYRRPKRTGAALADERLKALALKPIRARRVAA